jgi:hypothetical protein
MRHPSSFPVISAVIITSSNVDVLDMFMIDNVITFV